ncbi:hypothetical protein [Oceaniradius stylonematis]|jgi:hypothetical protein|uniref:hypothetical protein n=1 Tax=Oceaniradius stylonematis TaxID=2184161 RepID=UPI00273D8E84|nr:hypothetical protein [Oceaniradius stylonematis]
MTATRDWSFVTMVVLPFGLKSSAQQDTSAEIGADRRNELIFSSDPFAAKATLPGDPRFYVRTETKSDGTVMFTDFNGGAEPPSVLGAAIARLLDSVDTSGRLLFRDIYPDWQSDPTGRIEVERRIRFLKEAVNDLPHDVTRGRTLQIWEEAGKICASLEACGQKS